VSPSDDPSRRNPTRAPERDDEREAGPDPKHTEAPATATLTDTLATTRPRAGRWLVVSCVAFFLALYTFASVAAWASGQSLEPIVLTQTDLPTPLEAGVLVLGALLITVPHELIHGFALARYGGRPGYGIQRSRFVFPYAYVESEKRYSRNQMLVVLLSPLVVISVAGIGAAIVLESSWPLVLAAVNAAGSVGDCWLAARLPTYPASVTVGPVSPAAEEPDTDAIGIYGSNRADGIYGTVVYPFLVGAGVTVTVLVTTLVALVFLALAFADGTVMLGVPESTWFLFRHERTTHAGAVIEFGTLAATGLSVLGGTLWTLTFHRQSVD